MKFFKSIRALDSEISRYKPKTILSEKFAPIVRELLEKKQIHKEFTPEVIAKILSDYKFPRQSYIMRNFADVPVTLVYNPNYFIDLYFWQYNDTDIHNHHFTGAFQMLAGRQFQQTFAFKGKRVLPFLKMGELQHLGTKELFPGDVQEILPGNEFIHQTIHDPKLTTINLCIRTPVLEGMKLSTFFRPGYMLDSLSFSDERIRKASLIAALARGNQHQYITGYLEEQPLHALVGMLTGADLWTRSFMSPEIKEELLKIIGKKYPHRLDLIKNVYRDYYNNEIIHKKINFVIKT